MEGQDWPWRIIEINIDRIETKIIPFEMDQTRPNIAADTRTLHIHNASLCADGFQFQ